MKTLLTVLLATLFLVTAGCETSARLGAEPKATVKIEDVECGIIIDGKLSLCQKQE